jgi:hypothetical protein
MGLGGEEGVAQMLCGVVADPEITPGLSESVATRAWMKSGGRAVLKKMENPSCSCELDYGISRSYL